MSFGSQDSEVRDQGQSGNFLRNVPCIILKVKLKRS